MAIDRALSSTGWFWLREFPGWEKIPSGDIRIRKLETLVEQVLDPTRERWGPLDISSWTYWSDGTARTGAHADGGAADFVPRHADVPAVAYWMATALPTSSYGKIIDERDHIHVTRSGLQGATGQYFIEPLDGEYVPGLRPGDRLSVPLAPSIFPGLALSFPAQGRWDGFYLPLWYWLYRTDK